MPPVSTLTEGLDNLYTTTWQNMKSTVSDNIFDATPFWFWLRQNGGFDTEEGGRFITEPLRYAKSDNVTWITRGGSVTLQDKEFLTVAKFDWKYLVDTIVRFMTDDQQNRGKNQIVSLMNAKLDNSRDSLVDQLETRLVTALGAGGVQMLGLPDIIKNDPTTDPASGALGGISSVGNTWWRNQALDFNAVFGAAADWDDATNSGPRAMMQILNRCMNNRTQDAPNIFLTDRGVYEAHYNATLDFKRIVNKTLGDAGFQNLEFNGIPIIWSPVLAAAQSAAPAVDGVMYAVNTRYLKFRYDPMLFFDMTEWKPIPDQVNDRAAQIVTACNLVTGRRRVHGVIFNIHVI